jgi:hypothetical protein
VATGACAFGEIPCDGGEDCDAGAECCFTGTSIQCVAGDQCRAQTGREVCVTGADCVAGEVCCSSSLLTTVGVDAGICLPEADNCVLSAPAP